MNIAEIRPILLSAPYATPDDLEVKLHLKSGYRTTGLVEVTLEDGTTGLGEGYLAVFAPNVFVSIVDLVAPYLAGKNALDIRARCRDVRGVSDYWSLQGAARHVLSAFEIALFDASAKHLGVPVYTLLGGKAVDELRLYGSGGDSTTPEAMDKELELLSKKGIGIIKIRARKHQVHKTVWTLEQAAERDIQVAVDMTQNLADPAQSMADVLEFLSAVRALTSQPIYFLEEALGPNDLEHYPLLRASGCRIAGGEIVTTAAELGRRVGAGCYDLAQPDATVIGGLLETLRVFDTCARHGAKAVVHCWGGGVSMMANYHAAFAGGGRLAEWPMKSYPLREALMTEPLSIEGGSLRAPTAPGLGVQLDEEVEQRYPFREDAVYACLVEAPAPDERVWQPRETAKKVSA